jgi:hypothetical protein
VVLIATDGVARAIFDDRLRDARRSTPDILPPRAAFHDDGVQVGLDGCAHDLDVERAVTGSPTVPAGGTS